MPDLQRHKQIVSEFIATLIKDPQKAADLYIGEKYIQHEHGVADGPEAFVQNLNGWVVAMPEQDIVVKRLIAEDDLVVAHFHHIPNPGAAGVTAMDIFRLEDEKIVEHWTVHMPVPTEGDPVNQNGIF